MNSTAWNAWLATLPADRREEFGIVLDRITKIVDEMRSYLLDQLQRVERRQDTISQRQVDQAARIDAYEEQRARDVRDEIDRRLADAITREEHDALMTVIYELTTRIAQVEELRGLTVRVQALELRMLERGADGGS
jgi:hypothetical protein